MSNKLNPAAGRRKWRAMKPTALVSAKLACGTSHGGLVSMLFALFRRNIFQPRCVMLRLSAPRIATKVMFAWLFKHSGISVGCRDLTINGGQRLAGAIGFVSNSAR